ncbi:rRNA maturation RNase YbeY [Legionella dresdenensis]|uniref:Endoribonuclease YbeY n=1 Tax=Legionella dresdenensis TaxID=450200 RepID=A0ABV8CBM5_9GAMM
MNHYIDLQLACDKPLPVSEAQLMQWASAALDQYGKEAEITLRIVEPGEITELNHAYREKNKATNVLAFPSALPDNIELDFPLLGDVIVCPDVLEQEYLEQGKTAEAHWAHIVIHGVLHLLGYDHIEEKDAKVMEALETSLLAGFGIADPYLLEDEKID